MYGDAGDDSLDGGDGDDQMRGAWGTDEIDGGLGNDRIFEEADTNFVLIGMQLSSAVLGIENGRNVERFNIVGGAGPNLIDARRGGVKVLLSGLDGNDTLYGTRFVDNIFGGPGDDVLSGGQSNDILDGESGFDSFYEHINPDVTITGQRIVSIVSGDETPLNIERIAIIGGDGHNRFDARQSSLPVILLGGNGNDTLLGSALRDVLIGGSRTVTPMTGDGSDVIDGGGEADQISLDPADSRTPDAADQLLSDIFSQLPNWLDQT